jgi:putative ubiquitin-RnfH superfamily antitoxin RatB of RatAB toxin-antitoxin module
VRVEVAYAGPEGEAVDEVDVPAGATLAQAVDRSGLALRLGLDLAGLAFAIFGQRAAPGTPLREGDRIELLRPLTADPKDARRRRASENPVPRPRPVPGKGRRRAAPQGS